MVCQTYRWQGHYEGDMQTYKDKVEIEEWMKKDPILRFGRRLIETEILTEQETTGIQQEMDREIEKAVKFAEGSSYPDPEETLEDVYA